MRPHKYHIFAISFEYIQYEIAKETIQLNKISDSAVNNVHAYVFVFWCHMMIMVFNRRLFFST